MVFSQSTLFPWGKLVVWTVPLWVVAVVAVAILAGVFFLWKQR